MTGKTDKRRLPKPCWTALTIIKFQKTSVIQEENKTILWEPLEDFMKEHSGKTPPVGNENPLNSPVNFDRGARDAFDFLRAGDKLACHGGLGKSTNGSFHSYSTVSSDHGRKVKHL
ncbi:MAG TPA: hypothetical protein DHV36_06995 [Desulfobacteraceae bacterium]|nr:hypothetical protein [Desulfobacteraceae bacterium]